MLCLIQSSTLFVLPGGRRAQNSLSLLGEQTLFFQSMTWAQDIRFLDTCVVFWAIKYWCLRNIISQYIKLNTDSSEILLVLVGGWIPIFSNSSCLIRMSIWDEQVTTLSVSQSPSYRGMEYLDWGPHKGRQSLARTKHQVCQLVSFIQRHGVSWLGARQGHQSLARTKHQVCQSVSFIQRHGVSWLGATQGYQSLDRT